MNKSCRVMDPDGSIMIILLLSIIIITARCSADAEYQIFPGFDVTDDTTSPPTTTEPEPVTTRTTSTTTSVSSTVSTTDTTLLTSRGWWYYDYENTTMLPHRRVKGTCPEAEVPSNIGPYEVPTERDLVLLTIKTLHRMFASYHQKAMLFLDDIQKIVTATDKVARRCRSGKMKYRKCVKYISTKSEAITKSLTSSLEQQRQDILAFGQDTICSIQAMKEDPVKLIKILASEEASLEFALPGFLRLLNTCNSYCTRSIPGSDNKKVSKPSRHLTDTDVVIRHFLTKKNYKRFFQPEKQVFNIPVSVKNKRKA